MESSGESDAASPPAAPADVQSNNVQLAPDASESAQLQAELKRLRSEVRERDSHIDDLRGMLKGSESEVKERDTSVKVLRADLATADKVARETDSKAMAVANDFKKTLLNVSSENAVLHRKELMVEHALYNVTTVDAALRKEDAVVKSSLHNATAEIANLRAEVANWQQQSEATARQETAAIATEKQVRALQSRALHAEAELAEARSSSMGLKILLNQTLEGVGGIKQLIAKADTKMRHVDKSISSLKVELGKHAAVELEAAEASEAKAKSSRA